MKFLTVAAAIFASTSLAVPTNPNNGGSCVPNNPGGNTSSGPGGHSTGGNTSSGPGHTSTGGNTSSGPGHTSTGGNTSSGPGHTSTGGNTSSGPATTSSGSNTSSGPATTSSGSHSGSNTSSGPATTSSGSSSGSSTSSGPATTTTGNPGNGGEFHCPAGLYSNAQCCSTDVLGVVGLDCSSPSRTPISGNDFKGICSAIGKQAKCCVLPVAGQDVLCQDAIGGGPTSSGNGGNPTSSNNGGNPTTSSNGGNPTTSSNGGNPTTSSNGGNPTTSSNGGNPTTSSNGGGNPTSSAPGSNPTNPGNGGEFHCPAGLYSNAQCCSTDVLGVLGLDCSSPSKTPTSGDDFKAICGADGKQAKCCVLPVAGQDVLCQDAIGGGNPTSSAPGGGNPTSTQPGGGNPTTSSNGGNPTTSAPGSNPTNPSNGGEFHCPAGLYSNAQCCSTDVLGVLGLDCSSPSKTPTSGDDFKSICGAAGKQAKCCVLPVAGQDVLCQDAIGGGNPTSSAPGGGNPTSTQPGGSNPTTSSNGGNPTTSSNGGGNPTSSAPGSNPTNPSNGGEFHCPAGLYSNAQCCSTDVLGVLGLDCSSPSKTPTSGDDFKSICGAAGKQAKCCVLPVAGQDVLCQDAIGGGNPPNSGNPTSSAPGGGNPTSSAPGGNPTSSAPGGGNPTTTQPGGGNPTSTQPGGGSPTTSSPPDNGPVCPRGLYSNPQCCSTDVLGVADLDCSSPSSHSGPKAFGASCAAVGKQARCCVLPILGQSVLCQAAIGA
ncbi:hypothetical protein LMH87_005361 [Akanthomyces muscarius]|uniref:Trihydrophobin n=1 Tax=Akanthomyces muscarius TaxID=2231603 RepID=A0A9W8QNP4_AKAMU|nr:hypothetical protein LMH87_005361 [Akanthomyces muscarius]KAJ4163647.1 hypothetical protein LMH87_005361 [Akanthomyces muscarius]